MKRRNLIFGAASFAALSACKPSYPRASLTQVQAAYYRHPGPPSISLLSMVQVSTDASEHTGILINGSQRVLYDPAGSYSIGNVPRRNDINYGMTDSFVQHYESFHARLGFYTERLTVEVPLHVADLAIAKSEERGETIMTQCATSASWVLRQLPGFGHIRQTMNPETIRRDFSLIQGVTKKVTREDDEGKNLDTIPMENFDPFDTAPPRKPEWGRGEY